MRIASIFKKLKAAILRKTKLCQANIRFKDIHKGKRCFILCNGPSVNRQDLTLLKNEIVFSVSSGYHHKDYSIIRPKYHCVPGLTYSSYLTADDVVKWFREMDRGVEGAELFFDVNEEALIRKNRLFGGKKVNYLCMATCFSDDLSNVIDISRIIPGPQSVSIMCLMIAIYMGFKEIYLIGTEHDSAVRGEYKYFYSPQLLKGKDSAVNPDGKVKNLGLEHLSTQNLMMQYRILKRIADNKEMFIYNATHGGILEVYPRVDLAEVLSVKDVVDTYERSI